MYNDNLGDKSFTMHKLRMHTWGEKYRAQLFVCLLLIIMIQIEDPLNK